VESAANAVEDYKVTLRKLALRDDGFIGAVLEEHASPELSGLDARAHAIAQIAAMIALDAAPPSYMSAAAAGIDAGLSFEEIVGTMVAVTPIIGVARAVSAAPNLALALGYDVAEALEVR
jgi:4-carboxymuconolactone decarboxylase